MPRKGDHKPDFEQNIIDSDHFIVLLKKGVKIPDGFFDGVKSYKIFEWETTQEMQAGLIELLELKPGEKVEISEPYI